jgi:hydrogenase maturation factor
VVRGSEKIVLTADPITFTEESIGTYTVAVNGNDIVAMGGTPRYLTTTILLPLGTKLSKVRAIFEDIAAASEKAGILWVGGHTEVTSAVSRIVISAQAVGFIDGKPTTTTSARPGEVIVMTKWAGLEGTTLIARERAAEVLSLLGPESYREVLAWLEDPGISVIREGALLKNLDLGAAHDPTEGGIATGIHEIAERSRVGIRIQGERIPIRPETEKICRHFGLDPLGLLSSGTLLFTCSAETAESAAALLQEHSIVMAVIGDITRETGHILITAQDRERPLPLFERDEVIKLG